MDGFLRVFHKVQFSLNLRYGAYHYLALTAGRPYVDVDVDYDDIFHSTFCTPTTNHAFQIGYKSRENITYPCSYIMMSSDRLCLQNRSLVTAEPGEFEK